MKLLFVFPILLGLLIPYQTVNSPDENSPLAVVNYKWSRARRNIAAEETKDTAPAPAMIPQNRNFARNARINDPPGVRDPNQDTLDGRSAAMEKSVQESRTAKPKPQDRFAFKIKVQNSEKKAIEIVFWEYQFQDPSDASIVARRQFLCGVNIPGEKTKELEGFSVSGPNVVNVSTLADKSENPFKQKVLINRVEYADGSIWQRKGWSLADVKASYERVLREQWLPGMCKGL
jgi:hypothetical protein